VEYVPEDVQGAQRPGNDVDISLRGKKRIMKYIRPRSQPPSNFWQLTLPSCMWYVYSRTSAGGNRGKLRGICNKHKNQILIFLSRKPV